jgi:N-acyl-D-amino-acid deacylase
MGMANRPPKTTELQRMQTLLAEALHQGAWGLSTGLIYPPGSYADTAELVALARTVASHGALYASHIRNESDGLMTALRESIDIGREAQVRTQVSHLKAMGSCNRGRASEALALLAAARTAGVDIAADQYPYAASATSLTAVVPQWAHAGGPARFLERLADPALQGELTALIDREIARREGADGIMVTNIGSPENRHFSGLTIGAIATTFSCTPAEAVIRLLLAERGEVGAIFFSMAEEDVATIMADPHVAIGSDGHGLNAAASRGEATHPRSYGTFPRVLGHYVREQQLLSLAAAVRKMTALPAGRLGMTDRGLIRPGNVADLVLFDPAGITDVANYADPHHYATGIVHLLMDGREVIRDGKLTGIRCGKVLRKGAPCGC